MHAALSRFNRKALIVLAGTVAAAAGIAVAVILLVRTPVSDGGYGSLVPIIAVVLLLLGLGSGSLWNGVGLRRIRKLRPGALVFLARREPSLAPDLPLYLHRKDLSVDVSDRWLPGVVDERGIGVWSGGFRPRELLVMEWSELGEIAAIDYRSVEGQERFGVSVDVRPFATPLIVRLGYSMFGLQAALDREGTTAIAQAAAARRPVGVTPAP